MTQDKAGKDYWASLWTERTVTPPIDPRATGLGNYANRQFDAFFREILEPLSPEGKRLIEIGCAGSAWLPYFAREFGLTITGLDYTENGCAQSRAILASADVAGEVVCADFFSPPAELLASFDVLASFGVAEHFEDTAACLRAFSELLKPGGTIITTIPNLSGWLGTIQKRIDRSVYDIHVPLDREALCAAHEAAGLEVRRCEYFMSVNWSILSFKSWSQGPLLSAVSRMRAAASKSVWALEEAGLRVAPNQSTSPYIVCVAQKPCA